MFSSDGVLYCRDSLDDMALVLGLRRLFLASGPNSGASAQADESYFHARGTGLRNPGVGVYLFALRPKETLYAFGDRPLVMVMFHDPRGNRLSLDPSVVAAAYDLTPGEARVATGVAKGETPEQIAAANGVSVNTVKVQLRSVFGKTGTGRQAELVSLLAASPAATLQFRQALGMMPAGGS